MREVTAPDDALREEISEPDPGQDIGGLIRSWPATAYRQG